MANPNWKKGKSGNPKGRPKKGLAISDIFQDFLMEEDEDQKANRLNVIMCKAYDLAKEGSIAHTNFLADRGFGKPVQQTDITTDGESLNDNRPLEIVFNEVNKERS